MKTPPANFICRHFDSPQDLTRYASQRWLDLVSERRLRTVALSGGRASAALFRAVVASSGRVDWSAVHFFWADERCVPPDHPESNFRLAREELLDPLGVRPAQVHRLMGEADPPVAAARAEEELLRVAGGGGALDLVLLGMGEDGHVASAFPGGEEHWDDRNRSYVAVAGPKPPPRRITMTLGTLVRSGEVWVVVLGAGKDAALGKALAGADELPLGRVLRGRAFTEIFAAQGPT